MGFADNFHRVIEWLAKCSLIIDYIATEGISKNKPLDFILMACFIVILHISFSIKNASNSTVYLVLQKIQNNFLLLETDTSCALIYILVFSFIYSLICGIAAPKQIGRPTLLAISICCGTPGKADLFETMCSNFSTSLFMRYVDN